MDELPPEAVDAQLEPEQLLQCPVCCASPSLHMGGCPLPPPCSLLSHTCWALPRRLHSNPAAPCPGLFLQLCASCLCFVVKALWLCLSSVPPLLPPCLFHPGFPHPFVLPSSPQPSHCIPQIYMAFRLRGEIDQAGLMHLEELINDPAAHSPPLLWNNFSSQIKHPICHKLGKAKRAPLLY